MFLTELLEVLEVCELAKLDANIVTKLFKRLIKCIAGPQLQVIFTIKLSYFALLH